MYISGYSFINCVLTNRVNNVQISGGKIKKRAGLFEREGGSGNLLSNFKEILSLSLSNVNSSGGKNTVTAHKHSTKQLSVKYIKLYY